MGRNQLDLLLLLSVLLVGSIFYNKNLKDHIVILHTHCTDAKKENKHSIETSKDKLVELTLKYPQFKEDISAMIKCMDPLMAGSIFALSDKDEIEKTYQELIKLQVFSKIKLSEFYNAEALYVQSIQTAFDFIQQRIDEKQRQVEFTILVESIENRQDHLEIKLTPFNRYRFRENELYAFSYQDSSLIESPEFLFCGDLPQTKFVVRNEFGDHLSFTQPNPINSMP